MPEHEPRANLSPAAAKKAAARISSPVIRNQPVEPKKKAGPPAWDDMPIASASKGNNLYEHLVRVSPNLKTTGQKPRSRSLLKSAPGRTILQELERERSRIARELHAGAGQPLAGIKLNLEMLDQCAGALPAAGREALLRLQVLTEQALQQIRAVSHSLHPPEWKVLTTTQALHCLVKSSGLTLRLKVESNIQELPVEPSHTVKIALYRCAQEGISNVARHSGATRFKLSLLPATGGAVELRMEDNGHGFPKSSGGNGIGLMAIHEHSEALGGLCEITSSARGVRIRILLPLAEE